MSTPSLVLYWLKDGGSGKFPVPPLGDVLDYPPLPAYVNLFAANLITESDGSIGIDVSADIAAPLLAGQGKPLQAQGIKLVLSIFNANDHSVGWSTMNATQTAQLVTAIGNAMSRYALDGIDIDDEGMEGEGSPGNFYNTVSAIRSAYPDLVISNPVYDDQDMQKYQQYPNLANLMTYCATMNYGGSYEVIIGGVQTFNGCGIPMAKLYAGIRPGPPNDSSCGNGSFTSIATSKSVAQWTKTNCSGVMIFSFSQDIVDFTACPQHSGYPNPADHGWQEAVQSVLFGVQA
jgi:hypothetical protein